jgi:hypothetical protein
MGENKKYNSFAASFLIILSIQVCTQEKYKNEMIYVLHRVLAVKIKKAERRR